MSEPLVHVLIINWNGLEHLQECFDTLLAGTYENVRFVLIDNASTDDSVEYVRSNYGHEDRVKIIQLEENLGWSGGNNVGLRHAIDAGSDYVFLINNDTATEPDAIGKLVLMAEKHPEIGSLAPKMLMYDNPKFLNSVGIECSIIGCGWDLGIGRPDDEQWNKPRQVIGVCGGAWFIRTSVLEETGLLPEEFGIYLDDLDLCLRIWNSGNEIWNCPEAVVRHKFGATMGVGKRAHQKYYLNTRNRIWLLQRNFPFSKVLIVKPMFFVGEFRAVGRAILDGEYWRIWAHIKAYCAAIGYFPKAVAERYRRHANGIGKCKFWHLIVRSPMFSPGFKLPDK